MKIIKILVCLFLLITIMDFVSGAVRDRDNNIYEVTVNTHTAVTAGTYLPWRVYYHVENQSTQYDVKRATWPLTSTDPGKILRAPDGWWEDKYNVYMSSWYYIIIDQDGDGTSTPLSATISWQERD